MTLSAKSFKSGFVSSSVTIERTWRSFSFSCNKLDEHTCEACRLGKDVRLPFSASTSVSTFPFQLIHSDVWTSPVASNTGYLYYLVILCYAFVCRWNIHTDHMVFCFWICMKTTTTMAEYLILTWRKIYICMLLTVLKLINNKRQSQFTLVVLGMIH